MQGQSKVIGRVWVLFALHPEPRVEGGMRRHFRLSDFHFEPKGFKVEGSG